MGLRGRIFSINTGVDKGGPKEMVVSGVLREGHGFEGDAHAGPGHRQVSLLAVEDIEKAEAAGGRSDVDFRPGIFAENITTQYLDLSVLRVGDELELGAEAVLKITQIGKECGAPCSVARRAGRCIMPKQGVFASVRKGGSVHVHDAIRVLKSSAGKRIFPWSKT